MSASETRQRPKKASARFTPDEFAILQAAAESVGLSVAGYIRLRVLGTVTPRTQPAAPLPERQELARLLAQLGKIGGNLNQLAKLGNQGQSRRPALKM